MQDCNRFAFKEWAVICELLNRGTQSLILRKGGIHEGRAGFRVEHREFWLFPTEFHQQPDVLAPAARPLLNVVLSRVPAAGTIVVTNYIVVEDVIEILSASQLPRLAGWHGWSESTLESRFYYRMPMLFGLIVRAYRRSEPWIVPDSPHFGGCRSWVEFPVEYDTKLLSPVITDDEHFARIQQIRNAIA